MVMARGMLLVGAGLLPGLGSPTWPVARSQTLLLGVPPADPTTFATVIASTMLMALAGTLLPTLRALSIDPITAIRAE